MAFTPVQTAANSGTTASLTVGSTQGWAAPTAGNLLLVFANSDGPVTTPTGAGTLSAGPSVVEGNGTYVWYKFATGTETTVTFGNNAVPSDMGLLEYSGVSAFDAQQTATTSATGATSSPSVSVTTTAAGDLVVAFSLMHNGGPASGTPSWTNSFTNRIVVPTATAGAVTVAGFVADLTAGAAGAVSTVCTWTTVMLDRQALIIAFKASAGGAAVAPIRPKAPSRVPIFRAANY